MTEQCDQCRFFSLQLLPKFESEMLDDYQKNLQELERMTGIYNEKSYHRLWDRYHVLIEHYKENPDDLDVGNCRWERDNQPLVKRTHFCRHFEKLT